MGGLFYICADHLVTTRSVEVPSPDPRLGEDGSLLAKTKTNNEFKEELDQEGVSQTIPSLISSGKSNDEEGPPLLPKEKSTNEPENQHLEGASQKIPAQTTYEGEDGSSSTK